MEDRDAAGEDAQLLVAAPVPPVAPTPPSFDTCEAGDGVVHCWGVGRLPVSDKLEDCGLRGVRCGQSRVPCRTFTNVGAGFGYTCAVRPDASAECWGDPWSDVAPPAELRFKSVIPGDIHACGILLDDTVACWGSNDDGKSTPPAGAYKQISLGGEYSCGIHMDGTVECWGK